MTSRMSPLFVLVGFGEAREVCRMSPPFVRSVRALEVLKSPCLGASRGKLLLASWPLVTYDEKICAGNVIVALQGL